MNLYGDFPTPFLHRLLHSCESTDTVVRETIQRYFRAYPEDVAYVVKCIGRIYTIVSEEAIRYGREIQP